MLTYLMDHTVLVCSQETQDMAAPAMQLATKIPDKRLQVWAASLLAGELRVEWVTGRVECYTVWIWVVRYAAYVNEKWACYTTGC